MEQKEICWVHFALVKGYNPQAILLNIIWESKVINFLRIMDTCETDITCRIWGSHSGGYEEYHLQGYTPCSPEDGTGHQYNLFT
jgi:hypothetical protein